MPLPSILLLKMSAAQSSSQKERRCYAGRRFLLYDKCLRKASLPIPGSDNVVSPNYDKDYYDGCRESYSLKSGDSGNVTFSTSTTDEELVSLVSNAYSQVMSAARREYETTVAMESRSI